ncbi:hypothetical protein Hanom_Chr03g00257181 [Helianthus anomalus]
MNLILFNILYPRLIIRHQLIHHLPEHQHQMKPVCLKSVKKQALLFVSGDL